MTHYLTKPESLTWLGFSLLGDKLWVNCSSLLVKKPLLNRVFRSHHAPRQVINNPDTYAFFSMFKQHFFHSHKTQTQFCNSLFYKTLESDLRLYPHERLYYTTTTNFFNI